MGRSLPRLVAWLLAVAAVLVVVSAFVSRTYCFPFRLAFAVPDLARPAEEMILSFSAGCLRMVPRRRRHAMCWKGDGAPVRDASLVVQEWPQRESNAACLCLCGYPLACLAQGLLLRRALRRRLPRKLRRKLRRTMWA